MSDAKQDISAFGLKPNKALGQNFLCDENAIASIVRIAAEPGLPLIEIGPGLGALTLPLAGTGLPLAAVELDSALAGILQEKLFPYPNASVVNADFLKTDIPALRSSLGGAGAVAVGNLPYYITSPICERLVLADPPFARMALMMQKEAAERFFARPGDKNYGPLTVMSRCVYDISTALELSPAAYYPQPEVSSCVLLFTPNGAKLPALLPRLLKCAFAMRRKTLYNNLPAMGVSKLQAAEAIEKLGLPASVRAEALDTSQFVALAELISQTPKQLKPTAGG